MRLENQPPQMATAQKQPHHPPGMPLHPKTAATSTAQANSIQLPPVQLSPESEKTMIAMRQNLDKLLQHGFCD